MNIITGYLIGVSLAFTGYAIPNTITVSLPIKTLDSEITRLAEEYKVSEKAVRAIIQCESEMYGTAINENTKGGEVWSRDYGPFQINDYYHKERMTELGLDIYNQFDSLEYGFILIKSQGFDPWTASRHCWFDKYK